MKISLLASGSKGNALLVCAGKSRVLVDAGLSARELGRRLASAGVEPQDLDGVLVTHEHLDHVRGLGVFSRRWQVPVYAHCATAPRLVDGGHAERLHEFETGTEMVIGDLAVKAFPVSHDAAATVGFTITSAAGKVGVATDLGLATRLVAEELRRCRCLVLEFNHDEELLRDGPYPWPLKQRIRSSHGHLSNPDSAVLLEKLCWEGLEALFLAHLSETNNRPELAEAAALSALSRQHRCRPQLAIGCQERPVGWMAQSR